MTSEQNPTDEATSAYQESLRPPGGSLPDAPVDGDDDFDADHSDEEWAHGERMRRAGYEPDDVSGDTDMVRPQ